MHAARVAPKACDEWAQTATGYKPRHKPLKMHLAASAGKEQTKNKNETPLWRLHKYGRHSLGRLRGNAETPVNQFRPMGEKWKRETGWGTQLAVFYTGKAVARGGLSILLEPTCAWWWMEIAAWRDTCSNSPGVRLPPFLSWESSRGRQSHDF